MIPSYPPKDKDPLGDRDLHELKDIAHLLHRWEKKYDNDNAKLSALEELKESLKKQLDEVDLKIKLTKVELEKADEAILLFEKDALLSALKAKLKDFRDKLFVASVGTPSDPEIPAIEELLESMTTISSSCGAGAPPITLDEILKVREFTGDIFIKTFSKSFLEWLNSTISDETLFADIPAILIPPVALVSPDVVIDAVKTIICNGRVPPYQNLLHHETEPWHATSGLILLAFVKRLAKFLNKTVQQLLEELNYSAMLEVVHREWFNDKTLSNLKVSHLLDAVTPAKSRNSVLCLHCLRSFTQKELAEKELTKHLESFYGSNIKRAFLTMKEELYESTVQKLLLFFPVTSPPVLPPVDLCPFPSELDPSVVSSTIGKKTLSLLYSTKTHIFRDSEPRKLPVAVYGYPRGAGGYIVTLRRYVHQGPKNDVILDEIICLAAINNTSRCFNGLQKVDLYGSYRYSDSGDGCPCCDYLSVTKIQCARTQRSGYKPLNDEGQCKTRRVVGQPFCLCHSV